MNVKVVEGDLLDPPVDAIVNAWNRNVIPWWLLRDKNGLARHFASSVGMEPYRSGKR
jgi:hypothetical protein